MKTNSLRMGLLVGLVLALLVPGCATKPKEDWNTRVGTYTFDQAVVDMGPPDRQVSLSDGRKVAEWVTGHSGGSGFSMGVGGYGSRTGVGISQTIGSGGFERTLRLTFDIGGKLTEWKRN
jgi:hypothetical protein